MILKFEPGLAFFMAQHVLDSGIATHPIRDIRRAIRSAGFADMTEGAFYDTLKEMYDAGWIRQIDYREFYIVFDLNALRAGTAD